MLEVRLLGQFEVLRDGKRITVPTRNAQTLFAYLVMNPGKTHRRERLAGLLWPNSSEDNARSNLRHELWRLRKALETGEEPVFTADDLIIGLDPHIQIALDVEKLASVPVDSTAEALIQALVVYRGELLPGFYDEWVFLERDHLVALYEARITRLLDILQLEQRWAEVIDWGTRWIALGQWPEPAFRALMAAYANTGDTSKAVLIYERYAQSLQKNMGIKPSEPTQALYKRLKTGWKQAETDPTPSGAAQPKKSVNETATPIFTLPKVHRSNLPRPLTSFIGREKEIQQVSIQVTLGRLVTITGSGGVGKTRLAIQVAEELAPHFQDGVWWVELAARLEVAPPKRPVSPHAPWDQTLYAEPGVLMEADLVTQAVAKALRVPESPGQSLLECIVDALRDQKLLLVLDNCEHLIETCASLVERLLRDCPQVTILATSREALGVPGEKAWRLPSLSLPGRGLSSDLQDPLQSEAVSMFIKRTTDILPGYQPGKAEVSTIAQICLRLDGIPLAIELAAARMNLLSAQEIAARLSSSFSLLTGGYRTVLPRHQTLQAAIEWSYDLLYETERMLFRRLAIFTGSFSLQAAEVLCTSQEIEAQEVLTLVGRLVDKSLLNVEPALQDNGLSTRYRFLETIRSFGRLKLDEAQETRWMSTQHADYYVRLVETAEPELFLQNQYYWHTLFQAERENFRAVVEYSVENDQAESALRLAGALLWFWYRSGTNSEGSDLALMALTSPSAVQFKKARARALNTAGFLLCLQGDTTSASQLLEEALTILRASDDKVNLSWTLQFLGLVLAYKKEYDLANAAISEGLDLARKVMDNNNNSFLFFLGDVYLLKGETSRAKQTYEESVNIMRAIGNKSFLAYPLRRLGYLALAQNDTDTAWIYFQESLLLNQEVGDMPGLTASLASLSALAIHLKKPVEASWLYGVVENRLESLSVNLLYTDQAEYRQLIHQLPAYLDKGILEAAISNGCKMSEEQAIEMVTEIIGGEDGQTKKMF